jgi:hypothetical protein
MKEIYCVGDQDSIEVIIPPGHSIFRHGMNATDPDVLRLSHLKADELVRAIQASLDRVDFLSGMGEMHYVVEFKPDTALVKEIENNANKG